MRFYGFNLWREHINRPRVKLSQKNCSCFSQISCPPSFTAGTTCGPVNKVIICWRVFSGLLLNFVYFHCIQKADERRLSGIKRMFRLLFISFNTPHLCVSIFQRFFPVLFFLVGAFPQNLNTL